MPSFNTIGVHGGEAYEPSQGIAPAIYQTATWTFDEPAELATAATTLQDPTFYGRCSSPNVRQVEATLAQLAGGEEAIVSASGIASISLLFFTFLRAGDHVVSQQTLYPATRKWLTELLPQWGIEVTLVDQRDLTAWQAAIRPNTRLLYIETPANPTMTLTDIIAVTNLAQQYNQLGRSRPILTASDNTFATPYHQQTLALGVDLELHSATKYLAGHSDVVAGAIIGRKTHIAQLFAMHNQFGATLHPQEAWLLRRGLKTFGLRMAQHSQNALIVAQFLQNHPAVQTVYYPGLPNHPQHTLAKAQMQRGFGGMVAFELKGGREAGYQLLKKVRLIQLAVSLGGVHSLITHPASTIGAPLSEAQLHEAGIAAGLVRLSVGIEDSADLLTDLDQALIF